MTKRFHNVPQGEDNYTVRRRGFDARSKRGNWYLYLKWRGDSGWMLTEVKRGEQKADSKVYMNDFAAAKADYDRRLAINEAIDAIGAGVL